MKEKYKQLLCPECGLPFCGDSMPVSRCGMSVEVHRTCAVGEYAYGSPRPKEDRKVPMENLRP